MSAVENFKAALQSQHKISKKNVNFNGKIFENYRINIKNSNLCADLISHGCIPNKTFVIEMPNIEEKYMNHYLNQCL